MNEAVNKRLSIENMNCKTCGKPFEIAPYFSGLSFVWDCEDKEHITEYTSHEVERTIIKKEAQHITALLKHPAGFDLGCGGMLCLRPVSEDTPPSKWEVDWNEWSEFDKDPPAACPYFHHQDFDNLEDAVKFFVEKRHEMSLGLDLEREA
jgi:hypothetical protein